MPFQVQSVFARCFPLLGRHLLISAFLFLLFKLCYEKKNRFCFSGLLHLLGNLGITIAELLSYGVLVSRTLSPLPGEGYVLDREDTNG